MAVKPITDARLGVLADALLREPIDLQPAGHWIGRTNDVYLTRDELLNLVATAVVVEHECIKYGLEDMGGNHAQVLLRHIAGSRAATEGAQAATIKLLQAKLAAYEKARHPDEYSGPAGFRPGFDETHGLGRKTKR